MAKRWPVGWGEVTWPVVIHLGPVLCARSLGEGLAGEMDCGDCAPRDLEMVPNWLILLGHLLPLQRAACAERTLLHNWQGIAGHWPRWLEIAGLTFLLPFPFVCASALRMFLGRCWQKTHFVFWHDCHETLHHNHGQPIFLAAFWPSVHGKKLFLVVGQ